MTEYKPNPYSHENGLSAGERDDLSTRFAGSTEPPAISDFEAFETWSHQQIWDSLAKAKTEDINSTATAWRSIYNTGHEVLPDFADRMKAAFTSNWQGASGQAAAAAVEAYAIQADQLLVSMLMLANDLDRTESVILEAKNRVGEPFASRTADSSAAVVEGAAEAEAEARRVMQTFYQPQVAEVDARTPRLPEPEPVAQAPAGGGSSGGAAGESSGTGDAAVGGAAGGGGASDAATRAASTSSQPSASQPSASQPSAASGGGTGGGASGTSAGGGSVGSTSSGGPSAGLAGGAAGALAAAAPQLRGPLARAAAAGPGATLTSGGAGNGRIGAPMGGMYPPMGRGRGEEEDSREPSAYLVAASNSSELVGELPLTTQPVIGE